MLIYNLLAEENAIYKIIGLVLGLLVGITVHEFAHAWEADRLGDPTARRLGRLTLNPLSHLDPFGTIFLFLVGFGWGKPVPYNPEFLRHGKMDELKIAVAGPISNLLFALIFALPYRLCLYLHLDLVSLSDHNPLIIITQGVTVILIVLAVFNLLPIPPLDGSKIIFLFLSNRARALFEKIGPLILMAIIAMVYFFNLNIFSLILLPLIQFFLYLFNAFPNF